KWAPVEESHRLVEHAAVAGRAHVAARRKGQPQKIIRAARAHTASLRWMPPVLDVALRKLPRRAAQQMLAHEERLGVNERHHVLQLVAEAERPARLIKRVAPP